MTKEVATLKDELEVYKHASEKLKRSENALKKLQKKQGESADILAELTHLKSQNESLVQVNRTWEKKYQDLIRSPTNGPRPGEAIGTDAGGLQTVSEMDTRYPPRSELPTDSRDVRVTVGP